ncbi:MAG: gamma-glutamyl-gamma-aminobutyrate hydrolase family protein [Alphaproteobacteria bacterium]|nr:gamma-glutamyl-gamma-aminobutyrate hydrolase family protein [Alphaproteobacteria bacterium]
MSLSRPVLVLDAYVDPAGGAGNLLRWLDGRPSAVVRTALGQVPSAPSDYAAALITGSAASFADGVPWGGPLLAFLRAAAADGLPVLGVCFGHQAIGEAFAGPGAVRKAPLPEVGFKEVVVDVPGDPVLGALGARFTSFLSHEDEVAPAPRGLEVLAHSAACPVQAVKVPGAPIWGVQWHAEMGRDEQLHLLAYRAAKHPQLALDVDAEAARATQATDVAPVLFGAFLDVVAATGR